MKHHYPDTCTRQDPQEVLSGNENFPFSPGNLCTNMRLCYEAQCGYSKAICGLVTKACPHHRQKRCFSRVKFTSGVLQTEEGWTGPQHQLHKGITETLLALTSCYWMNERACMVKSCSCPGKFFTVLPTAEVLQTFTCGSTQVIHKGVPSPGHKASGLRNLVWRTSLITMCSRELHLEEATRQRWEWCKSEMRQKRLSLYSLLRQEPFWPWGAHEAPRKQLPSKTGRATAMPHDEQSRVISSEFSAWYWFNVNSIVNNLFSGCHSPWSTVVLPSWVKGLEADIFSD